MTATAATMPLDTPIGQIVLEADGDVLIGLRLPNDAGLGRRDEKTPVLKETATQLQEYFAGERRDFDLPLNPHGSETARQVWQLLAEISYGQTTTYGALAARIGGDISPRDIGGFVGHNPLSIFIACHRVVGSTGKLTGYAGGVDRKRYLLELEKAIPAAPQALW